MGLGPVEASKQALARAGMTIGDIDLVEINEAFAAQVIPSYQDLGIDLDRLNVNGGAIAVGHPFGMTGARITTTLLNSLQWHDKTFGLETMCVGGGQGMAMVLERPELAVAERRPQRRQLGRGGPQRGRVAGAQDVVDHDRELVGQVHVGQQRDRPARLPLRVRARVGAAAAPTRGRARLRPRRSSRTRGPAPAGRARRRPARRCSPSRRSRGSSSRASDAASEWSGSIGHGPYKRPRTPPGSGVGSARS